MEITNALITLGLTLVLSANMFGREKDRKPILEHPGYGMPLIDTTIVYKGHKMACRGSVILPNEFQDIESHVSVLTHCCCDESNGQRPARAYTDIEEKLFRQRKRTHTYKYAKQIYCNLAPIASEGKELFLEFKVTFNPYSRDEYKGQFKITEKRVRKKYRSVYPFIQMNQK